MVGWLDETKIKATLAPSSAGAGVGTKLGKNQLSWVKLGLGLQQICVPICFQLYFSGRVGGGGGWLD